MGVMPITMSHPLRLSRVNRPVCHLSKPVRFRLPGGTAWETVVRRLAVRPGETILIHGGAGGVGSFAVQFAKAAGARVLASASADNQNFLRELGADVTIDYRKDDAAEITLRETYGYGADAAFDIEGINIVARCLPAVRPFGRVACVLPPQGDLSPLYQKYIILHRHLSDARAPALGGRCGRYLNESRFVPSSTLCFLCRMSVRPMTASIHITEEERSFCRSEATVDP